MATIGYVGKQRIRREVKAWNITATTTGALFTLTCNGKVVEYLAGVSDTTTTVAAGLATAVGASTDGEFGEMTAASTGAVLLLAGPADGAPITVTLGGASGGTVSTNAGLTVTPLSPYDAADGANYSGGAVPSAADTLVVETPGTSIKYGLDALSAIALSKFRRAATHDGTIGLPSRAAGNFAEYRDTRLELACSEIEIETSSTDQAGQIRLALDAGTNADVTIRGTAKSTVGREPVDLIGGLEINVNCNRSGVSIATTDTEVASVDVFTLIESSAMVGPGLSSFVTVKATDSNCEIETSFTSLTLNGGEVVVKGSAAGTPTIHAGTLKWKSSGTLTTPAVRSGGTLDLSESAVAAAVSGNITLEKGATLNDPASRLSRSYTISIARADLRDVTVATGLGGTVTVAT